MRTQMARPAQERTGERAPGMMRPGLAADSPHVSQLRARQGELDQSPRVRELSRVGTSLNPGAPASAAPIQRMDWRKQGGGVVPEDTTHGGPAPDLLLIPPTLEEHQIWDDATNNVYDGETGLLRYNHHVPQAGDELVPEDLRTQFTALGEGPSASSKGVLKSYLLKLNTLSKNLTSWIAKDALPDSEEAMAGLRLKARVEAIKHRPVLRDQPNLPPKENESARASLALGGAADRLYRNVVPGTDTPEAPTNVDVIDSTDSEVPTGRTRSVETGELTPSGDGLLWWASAAQGLRQAAEKEIPGGKLLHLAVGSGKVPIGVKGKSKPLPKGEFIVLGHDAPIAYDENPNQQGLRTPGTAGPQHKVSYPEFLNRLSQLQKMEDVADPVLAQAMLEMVKNPTVDPPDELASFHALLREMLVTWMVAEPARHRSVIFNSVLSLQEIARGTHGFADMLPDNGLYPMTGGGTARAGRQAEESEKKLFENKPSSPPTKVENRQKEQLKRTATGGDLSSPLEQVLFEHGIGGTRLRYVPQDS
ncbi:hypothetical protein LXT21_15110 [Myxococcus sp. K38C18041901]|uniref:hypothetical protein n=1 Tax=Myxococcus guangdongensis TaxID=2906760 RepID=UPI0020A7D458|nr:hypothetical protein [Myxococcus guangdongensis]MCP3060111.1 hypothetical protein [Myxococcus guangdongensis]